MADLIAVPVRDCACPGTPHAEGDIVYVLPTLPLEGGLAAEHDRATALSEAIAAGGPQPKGGFTEAQKDAMSVQMAETLRRRWLVTYVRYGAKDWNLVDESGPVPFTPDALLADYGLARLVAEKCDELYGETVALPLLRRRSPTSPAGQTARKTSAKASTRRRSGSSSPRSGLAATKRLTA